MKRLSGYPSWFYWGLLVTCLMVLGSGLAMIPSLLEFKFEFELGWRLSSDSRLWTAAGHVLTSWLLLMMLGALWHSHMRAGWRKRLNRGTGLGTVALMLGLAVTGVGLYYLGSEAWQAGTSVAHTAAGVVLPGVLIGHMVKGHAIRGHLARHRLDHVHRVEPAHF